jgi:hypothetical protein
MNGRRPFSALLVLSLAPACGSGGESFQTCGPNAAGYAPVIDPADFSATIDNKYLSYAAGTMARYVQSGGEVVEVDVTSDTKVVMGVKTLVVHDFLKSAAGELLEDTYDYYAQDRAGNVWYFGEDTKAYAGTQVSTEGSWLAGAACARPGVVMKANPQVGDKYRQEYLEGHAEDEAEVVALGEKITVPYGALEGCIKTKELTRLAPGDLENKYYCPGVFGPVSSVDVGTIDAGKREDLVTVNGTKAGP